jgi:hypothetical protein
VSFDFDSKWTPTALTPETVPAQWMLLASAFKTFDREVGAHCAALDLQRALAAGWIKRSMALRDVGTPERPIWQQRELPNDFWRLLAFYAKVDHDGKAALGYKLQASRKDHMSLSRNGGWRLYLWRAEYDAASARMLSHGQEPAQPGGPGKLMALVSVLDAIQKETGSLLGIQQDTLLKKVKTRLPEGVNVSLSTLKRAQSYRRRRTM